VIVSVPAVAISRVIVGLIDSFLPNSAWYALLQVLVGSLIAITAFLGINQFRPINELSEAMIAIRRKPDGKTN
jgi:hypothetical protein